MFRLTRVRPSRLLVAVAGGAAIVTMTAGIALATTSSGYKACANSGGRLALQNSSGNCPSNFSKVTLGAQGPRGKTGPQGPSGVVSMTQYQPTGSTAIPGSWAFLGSALPPVQSFTSSKTAAQVTATVDEASTNGSEINDFIGVCYEAVGGSTVTNVSHVEPQFAAATDSFFAQTVSGVVGNLTPGNYYVGLCADDQTNVANGLAEVTILLAQTSSGVSYDGPMAGPAHASKRQ